MKESIAKIRAALEMARDYITSDLASERGAFEGYEGLSRIGEIKADIEANDEALAALAELERAAEPVAWQYRLDGDCEWSQCSMRGFDTLVSIGECETRQLYTTTLPAQPAPGMFTAEEMKEAYFEGYDDCYVIPPHNDWRVTWPMSDTHKLIKDRTP